MSGESGELLVQVGPPLFLLCEELNATVRNTSCYDALGLLLMIRVTHAHQLIMERRRVPCLVSNLLRGHLLLD
jgi:hypothetical protein